MEQLEGFRLHFFRKIISSGRLIRELRRECNAVREPFNAVELLANEVAYLTLVQADYQRYATAMKGKRSIVRIPRLRDFDDEIDP